MQGTRCRVQDNSYKLQVSEAEILQAKCSVISKPNSSLPAGRNPVNKVNGISKLQVKSPNNS